MKVFTNKKKDKDNPRNHSVMSIRLVGKDWEEGGGTKGGGGLEVDSPEGLNASQDHLKGETSEN